MSNQPILIETDYLIIGAGATGMAFADVLVTETSDDIVMVDRYAKPGGHWNVAYPFVTLHQPSQFYGVSSKEMSNGKIDKVGLNKGLYDLATGQEVLAYYDEVMHHQFLPSGQVRYFPMHNYEGNHVFSSQLDGKQYQVKVRKKIVDATYLKTEVPATHTPNFDIEEGVSFMPINDLVKLRKPAAGYVVIGGGKTGIDACLWLLEQNIDPYLITWIVSRDAWLLPRENVQPTEAFFNQTIGAQAAQFEAVAEASSITDLFDRLENKGVLTRIDRSVRPSMFHGATISKKEVEALNHIKRIIRKGRVQRLTKSEIIFKNQSIPTSTEHVHIDCSATPIRSDIKMVPVFQEDVIVPQTVRSYQPTFSAAFIAYIEANFSDEKEKNRICQVVPLPNHDTDWIRMLAVLMVNQFTWSQYKNIRAWLTENRLDGFAKMVRSVDKDDEEKQAILMRMKANAMPAMQKLQQFLAQLETTSA